MMVTTEGNEVFHGGSKNSLHSWKFAKWSK